MKNSEDLGNEVFEFLKGLGISIALSDKLGEETLDAQEAHRFYSQDPNIMITIDTDNKELKLSKSKHVEDDKMDRYTKALKILLTNTHLILIIKFMEKRFNLSTLNINRR